MLSFWRKYPDLADIILPQKIMRPFWHPKANIIDNHLFSTDLPYERPLLICGVILVGAIMCLTLAALVLWQYAYTRQPRIELDNDLIITTLISVMALGMGGYLINLFIKAVPPRHWQLDRQTHMITMPMDKLVPSYYSDRYEAFQAKILHEINVFGVRRTRLVIEYQKTGQQICVFTTSDSTNMLVGYWSFIVQYMKPNAPLPDVPALNHFPNTTPGVRKQITNSYTL